MNDFFEHIGSDLRQIGVELKRFWAKLWGKPLPDANGSVINSVIKTNYEINLVPEVKVQMIKAQKMRNLVLFICILVSSVSVGAVVILLGIKSGQDIAMATQDVRLKEMSEKVNAYDELDNLITIQSQLTGISDIIGQKKNLVRVFGALGAMLPQGADSVQLSELNVDMSSGRLRLEGQADARTEPLIDYRVLESFKKGVELTKYDYGRYVDADGNQIPSYCISESDAEGNAYKIGDSYYAWWDLTIKGCEASQRGGTAVEGAKYYYSSGAEVEKGLPVETPETEIVCDENGENCVEQEVTPGQTPEQTPAENPETPEPPAEEGEIAEDDPRLVPVRVKIWRTPQFTTWYEAKRMSLEGDISGIEHFNSECYVYKGTLVGSNPRWTSTNDCILVPDGLEISESSNGRDESDNLVLRFSAVMVLNEAFFDFGNKHMIAIGPRGQNVTDSFIQIGSMFAQAATECEPDDTECLNNSSNMGKGNNTGGKENG